ncbi:MAG: NAD(+)/NADH kinase [Desulfurococcales archaeon]|nr:NAD(+)/NADH kinase [Desulfurococcales archaeon]
MKGIVGLAVNPVSGTDIRRVASTAGFIDNMQKVRIVKGILRGLEAMDVSRVLAMPDFYGIVAHALWDTPRLDLNVEFVDIEPEGNYMDTVRSIELMVKEGVDVVILLGGDGTVRVASKASGDTPLLPVSTGTNNVIPYLVDGTIAGVAAAAVAKGWINRFEASYRIKRINVYVNGEYVDHGLVEVAGTRYPFVASKAILDPGMVNEIVAVTAPPTSIGLASIAAMIKPVNPISDNALYVKLGRGFRVKAILSPGVIDYVSVSEYREIPVGSKVELEDPLTVELDGERVLQVAEGDEVVVEPAEDGPYIVNIDKVMHVVSLKGYFIDKRRGV